MRKKEYAIITSDRDTVRRNTQGQEKKRNTRSGKGEKEKGEDKRYFPFIESSGNIVVVESVEVRGKRKGTVAYIVFCSIAIVTIPTT